MVARQQRAEVCLFCNAPAPFAVRDYDRNPAQDNWPPGHCFEGKSIAICQRCGGGFVAEPMRDEDIAAFYDALYRPPHARIAPAVSDLHEFSPRFLSQVLYLKSFVALTDGMRVLEIGPNAVSALPTLLLFCRPRYHYYDQVESPIIRRHGGQRLGNYASGTAIMEHFGAGRLDLVYTSHSVEHLNPNSLHELFESIAKALRRSGHVFVEVPFDLGNDAIYPPHTLFFTLESLRQLLERHGFRIMDLAAWGTRERDEATAAAAEPSLNSGCSGVPAPARRRLKERLRRYVLGVPFLEKRLRTLRLRRGLARALRSLPTPYDSRPFIRVIGQKT